MIDGKPMFPGKHYLDQISKIQVNNLLTFFGEFLSDFFYLMNRL
jgi:hypothetical protein